MLISQHLEAGLRALIEVLGKAPNGWIMACGKREAPFFFIGSGFRVQGLGFRI